MKNSQNDGASNYEHDKEPMSSLPLMFCWFFPIKLDVHIFSNMVCVILFFTSPGLYPPDFSDPSIMIFSDYTIHNIPMK